VQRSFPALNNTQGLAPHELSVRDGQQEETVRDLTVDLELEPGQVAVVGCRPESPSSLGSFLFSESPSDRDQRHQRLILIWASRNLKGVIAETPKANDRPKLFQRLVGPPPEPSPVPGSTPTPPPPPRADAKTNAARPKADAKAQPKPETSDATTTGSITPPDSPAPPLPSPSDH
jgi:hypothetical protein